MSKRTISLAALGLLAAMNTPVKAEVKHYCDYPLATPQVDNICSHSSNGGGYTS